LRLFCLGFVLFIDNNLLHISDLLSYEFVLLLQKLLIVGLVIFKDVRDGFAVFIKFAEGLVDFDGEEATGSVDDVREFREILQHIDEDMQRLDY
jgi:hypothetical protein